MKIFLVAALGAVESYARSAHPATLVLLASRPRPVPLSGTTLSLGERDPGEGDAPTAGKRYTGDSNRC